MQHHHHSALKAAPSSDSDEPEISPNVEMYLKTIVRIFDGREPVTTSAIAQELAVSAASASAMLKRLDADGYVRHEGRHGVVPTGSGARIGGLILRRQRLAERLLVDHLGIPWELASAEACRLEHAISPLVERRLDAFLRSPATCPHGHPIPRADGSTWHHDGAIELVDLPVGIPATVIEIESEIPELLAFIADVGIKPGVVVTVRKMERAVGLLNVEVAGKRHNVSLQLASDVLVRDPNAKPEREKGQKVR